MRGLKPAVRYGRRFCKQPFQAIDGTNGYELWVYDGTTDPSMVSDIRPGSSGSSVL